MQSFHSLTKRCFKVNRKDIAYLHFIVESYEGLATLSTVDGRNGIVLLSVPAGFTAEAELLLRGLKDEITITEIPFPEGSHDFWRVHSRQEKKIDA